MIMEFLRLLFFIYNFLILYQDSHKVLAADIISYVGAVVEYYPVRHGVDGPRIATANAVNYVTIIKQASNYFTDIIVFPEGTLTEGLVNSATNRDSYPSHSSFVPEPYTDIPCHNSTTVVVEALRLISCAAKQYSMYVVINLYEKVNCTNMGTPNRSCPSDGYLFYNTNVAFDRTGLIIARYRKFHLFGEAGFNTTTSAEISTFTTDFDVTFGQFICFDIVFESPALKLVRDHGITDIVFSTYWFSELPYLTANQAQYAWTYSNNVNFLASGYNKPITGSGGSGIYAGTRGGLIELWSENATNALLVARIPKSIHGVRKYNEFDKTYPILYRFSNKEISTLDGIVTVPQQNLLRDNLTLYTTKVLTLKNGTFAHFVKLCDRGLCCSFDVSTTHNADVAESVDNYYRYRFAVFNGVRNYHGANKGGIQVCSIISCTNDTADTCNRRFDLTDVIVRPTTFNSITIDGNFSTHGTTLYMPNSLTMRILPLNFNEFNYVENSISGTDLINIKYTLLAKRKDLLTFAIYGRNFAADEYPITSADSTTLFESSLFQVLTAISVILTFLFMIKYS